MPIYEYRCKECHQLFEEWCRHIEDDDVRHFCPICKGEARRLVSNTSFALKGGGWYVTEYGSRKNAEAKAAPGNGGSAPACSTSGGPAPAADTPSVKESAPVKAESPSPSTAH